ncbi:MAG: hypothetical protein Q9170_001760 [Blastenia crenularia]
MNDSVYSKDHTYYVTLRCYIRNFRYLLLPVNPSGAIVYLTDLVFTRWRDKLRMFHSHYSDSSLTLANAIYPTRTGGIVDDTVITRLGPETFYLVTNAACRDKDLAYLKNQIAEIPDAKHIDWQVLNNWGLIALQGPKGAEILQVALLKAKATDLEGNEYDTQALYFGQCRNLIVDVPSSDTGPAPILVSRGGYTGEDGFEISIPPHLTQDFAKFLLDAATPERLRLAGLGARDSLRLEAGMCLYGHDLNDDTTPVQAGLSWVIHKDRRTGGGFHGDGVILRELKPVKEGGTGPAIRRIGLTVEGAPAREGAKILAAEGDEEVGHVTSGCPSPTLGKNIAMGYVRNGLHKAGTELGVMVRGKRRKGVVTKMPFVASKYWKQAAGTAPG